MAASDNDMCGHGDQQLQNAAAKQPGNRASDGIAGVTRKTVEDDSPQQPEKSTSSKNPSQSCFRRNLVEETEVVPFEADSQRSNTSEGQNSKEECRDRGRNQNVGPRLEFLERSINPQEKEQPLTANEKDYRYPSAQLA